LVYLVIGEDNFSKDAKIKRIKEGLFSKDIENFNLDTLYAKDLTLRDLQERLLCLPVNAKKRIVIIKDTQQLKEDIRSFLLRYLTKPIPQVVLVFESQRLDPKDEFFRYLLRHAETSRFKETVRPDTFTLSRQIELRRPDFALRMLHWLLKNGEKPERILGGLRYALLRSAVSHLEKRRRLRLLLGCDIDIKTGRLRPNLALEKFVVQMCCLDKA